MPDRHDDHDVELHETLPAVEVDYGTPVAFAAGRPLRFRDFELLYRGRSTTPLSATASSRVFRVRGTDGDREVAILSGGALDEPGATWAIGDGRFTMDWVRVKGEPLREVVVNRVNQ